MSASPPFCLPTFYLKTTMTKLKFLFATLLVSGIAFAAIQQLDDNTSRFLSAFRTGILVGRAVDNPSDTQINANRVTRLLGASATVDFASAREGSELSAAITVKGARAGDACAVGIPAAAAALKAEFECAVTASDEVKIRFSPQSKQVGTATLVSASPSTVDVTGITASSYCTATPVGTTAAIAAGGVAASLTSTTLTLTGPNTVTTVLNYSCAAPVDPASGTFYVRVTSAQ